MSNKDINKTTFLPHKGTEEQCFQIDAKGKTVGRISTLAAKILLGKTYSAITVYDSLDFKKVYIYNAKDVVFSGNKWNKKMYYKISNRPGNLKAKSASEVFTKNPARVLEKAIYGMLPQNAIGIKAFKGLYVFSSQIKK